MRSDNEVRELAILLLVRVLLLNYIVNSSRINYQTHNAFFIIYDSVYEDHLHGRI